MIFIQATQALSLMLLTGCNTNNATLGDPFGNCWSQYESNVQECADNFNDEDNPSYHNQSAYRTCTQGADAALEACTHGVNQYGEAAEAWNRFRGRLRDCLEDHPNDEIARDSCIRAALILYRAELRELQNDDDDNACAPDPQGIEISNPIYTLQAAAYDQGNADGKYATPVNTTLTFTSGVNPSSGNSYDIRQIPCAASAVTIALYNTKQGAETFTLDADLDTTDGVTITTHLLHTEFVDASDVIILVIFYDDQSVPLFTEQGVLRIQDSPISGDWNRDMVLNSQDIIDFLASYDAQTKRADLNNDDQVNTEDAQEFTETVND